MRWMRVARLSALFAALAGIAVGALTVAHWVKAELHRRANMPDPIVATPEETRAILGAVLERMKFVGVPPPPPEAGNPPRSEPKRILILVDQSLCFAGNARNPNCESEPTERLLVPELDPLAPRKLREELAVANQAPNQLYLSGIPGTKIVSSAEIRQIFANGWWNDFYKDYPGTSGYASISRPVLTKDRRHALIFVAHHCDGLCGTGTIHFLERSGAGWRIVKEEMLWIS